MKSESNSNDAVYEPYISDRALYEANRQEYAEFSRFVDTWRDTYAHCGIFTYRYEDTNPDEPASGCWSIWNGGAVSGSGIRGGEAEIAPPDTSLLSLLENFRLVWGYSFIDSPAHLYYGVVQYKDFAGIRLPYRMVYYRITPDCEYGKSENYFLCEITDFKFLDDANSVE